MLRSCLRTFLIVGIVVATAGCGAPSTRQTAAVPEPTEPGRLLPIMIDLGENMNAISDGLWKEDLQAVSVAALAIAEHPRVSDSERERVQAALGTSFAEFVQGDGRVHETAMRLSEVARAGDVAATLAELTELQSGCVSCHRAFRQKLR